MGKARYIDRRTGALREDASYAPRFLGWCYGTAAGWWLTRILFTRPWVSRLYGWLNARPASRRKIRPFVELMGIDTTECVKPLADFTSFADFITREIDLARRPPAADPAACVSPADARVLVYENVARGQWLPVKHTHFELAALLGDEALARRYDHGAAVVLRLHLADYHHFHFPVDGVPAAPRVLGGRLYAMGHYAPRRSVPYLTENVRMLTAIAADRFGLVTMIEIGAFSIGSICQRFAAGQRAARGAHKGLFALGGSSIVLIFERGAIALAADLRENTARGIETYVRMGESLGTAVAKSPP